MDTFKTVAGPISDLKIKAFSDLKLRGSDLVSLTYKDLVDDLEWSFLNYVERKRLSKFLESLQQTASADNVRNSIVCTCFRF
jgi:hypothetical protein